MSHTDGSLTPGTIAIGVRAFGEFIEDRPRVAEFCRRYNDHPCVPGRTHASNSLRLIATIPADGWELSLYYSDHDAAGDGPLPAHCPRWFGHLVWERQGKVFTLGIFPDHGPEYSFAPEMMRERPRTKAYRAGRKILAGHCRQNQDISRVIWGGQGEGIGEVDRVCEACHYAKKLGFLDKSKESTDYFIYYIKSLKSMSRLSGDKNTDARDAVAGRVFSRLWGRGAPHQGYLQPGGPVNFRAYVNKVAAAQVRKSLGENEPEARKLERQIAPRHDRRGRGTVRVETPVGEITPIDLGAVPRDQAEAASMLGRQPSTIWRRLEAVAPGRGLDQSSWEQIKERIEDKDAWKSLVDYLMAKGLTLSAARSRRKRFKERDLTAREAMLIVIQEFGPPSDGPEG